MKQHQHQHQHQQRHTLCNDEILSFDDSMVDDFISTYEVSAECNKIELISLEDAGLEEADSQYHPVFGGVWCNPKHNYRQEGCVGSVIEYIEWFYDGEDSRYESN